MTKTNEFTQTDVRKFITSILLVGDTLNVTDDGEVQWKGDPETKTENEPVILDIGGGGKGHVYTYTPNAKRADAIIINPFNEGLSLTADRSWFYSVTSTIFSGCLARAMGILLHVAANKDSSEAYPSLMSYITPIVNRVDEKILTEFTYICETGTDDFCSLSYNTKAKESKIFLGIEDPSGEYQKSMPSSKVRKKTWETLQLLLKSIFKTEGPVAEDYRVSTPLITAPHFRTYMELWVRCWKAIAPILATVDEEHEELEGILDDIEKHLENFDLYCKMCQWSSGVPVSADAKKASRKAGAVATSRTSAPTPLASHAGGEPSLPVAAVHAQEQFVQKPKDRWAQPEYNSQRAALPSGFQPQQRQPRDKWDPMGQPDWHTHGYHQPMGAPIFQQEVDAFGRPVRTMGSRMGSSFGTGFGTGGGSLLNPRNR